MKPRLQSAALTEEDFNIYYVWLWRQPFKPLQMMTLTRPQDRRDADLMWIAQGAPLVRFVSAGDKTWAWRVSMVPEPGLLLVRLRHELFYPDQPDIP